MAAPGPNRPAAPAISPSFMKAGPILSYGPTCDTVATRCSGNSLISTCIVDLTFSRITDHGSRIKKPGGRLGQTVRSRDRLRKVKLVDQQMPKTNATGQMPDAAVAPSNIATIPQKG